MNNNQFDIDRYLAGQMEAGEKQAFEARLSADKTLRYELQIQQQLQQVIQDAGIKQHFSKAIDKRILVRRLWQWGIVAALVAALVFTGIKNNWFQKNKAAAQNNLHTPELFDINTKKDTVIETRDGVVFAIPAGAFAGGHSNVTLEIKTALTPAAILQQGLSTMSDNNLLQTAGMFYINAKANGEALKMEKEIAVSVPAATINPAMQLFDAVADSSGQINWTNPKPVENNLRTVDISRLNFYPPDYLPVLKALGKDVKDKRYTDSLYYSFAGFSVIIGRDGGADIETVTTTPGTAAEKINEGYFATDTSKKDTTGYVDRWRDGHATDTVDHSIHYEIDPARIRAIWNEKFAGTIIATKAFEERLQYMHGLCNPMCLDAYLQGLNRPLYETDQLLADASYGPVREKFLEFARRKEGKVIIAEGIQQNLANYYEQKVIAYQQAAAKTRAAYEEELAALNNIADEKRRQQAVDEFLQKEKGFQEEHCANLTDAYRQIGINRNCNDTIIPPDRPTYNFNISTPGWKNLDVYVFESTRDRQSMTYTDPQTGKTATLQYSDIDIRIDNEAQYDKVYVYLLPDSLNSFQRVKKGEGVYKEKLNSLFHYDAIVVAWKGTEMYYHRQRQIPPGSYTFTLAAIQQPAFEQEMNNYSGTQLQSMRKEAAFLLFQQEEMIRQVQVRKELEFRRQVMHAIFSCFDSEAYAPAGGNAK